MRDRTTSPTKIRSTHQVNGSTQQVSLDIGCELIQTYKLLRYSQGSAKARHESTLCIDLANHWFPLVKHPKNKTHCGSYYTPSFIIMAQ